MTPFGGRVEQRTEQLVHPDWTWINGRLEKGVALGIDGGRIRHYQIIAPTTWNFSPRSADGVPGPLEQALIGTAVEPGETVPLAVQHVVRSFDPCMSCTVH